MTAPRLPRVRPSLADLERLRDGPHEFLLAQAIERGPACWFGIGPVGFYHLSDPDIAHDVLVAGHRTLDKSTFQYRLLATITGEGLLTMDGPRWLARRRAEQPFFARGAIEHWTGLIVDRVGRMTGRWESLADTGSVVDIEREMLRLALEIIVAILFEEDAEAAEAGALVRATMTVLGHIMHRARTLGAVPGWLPTARNREFRAALSVLDARIEASIAAHREGRTSGRSLLAHLMSPASVEAVGHLSDQELRDEMVTMIIAGHETVASALAWSWHLLSDHLGWAERIAAEAEATFQTAEELADGQTWRRLEVSRAVFDETLRLYPPAWIVSRRANEPAEVAGVRLTKNALVVVSPYVMQRSNRLWNDPDAFDPDRFLSAERTPGLRDGYMPFGAGPHLCIGEHLGRLEAVITLAIAARRFRLRRIDGSEPVVAEPGVTLHPKRGLPMLIERR